MKRMRFYLLYNYYFFTNLLETFPHHWSKENVFSILNIFDIFLQIFVTSSN